MTSGIVGFRRGATGLFAAIVFAASALSAGAEDDPRMFRVMTQNLFIGTFYRELMATTTPQGFAAAVTTTYQHIQATKPAERMTAIAREIENAEPDLVGLQQAAIVRTGGKPPATTVEFDYVKILLAELASPAGVLVDPSGFAAIDVTMRGQSLRFVTTHFDVTPAVSLVQARELVQATSDPGMPTVLVCDCNATPDVPSDPSFATYKLLRDAGFIETFRMTRSDQPGFTCCQAEDLRNQISAVSRRIDLVQYRGPFRVVHAGVVGASPGDRTPSLLWPSDHAGVVATLRLGGAHQDAGN